MDFSFVTECYEVVVLLACLAVGYVLKKWINDVENKYIPTILLFLGAVLNCCVRGLTIESAVYGAIAGLASTGLHQAFTRFVEGKTEPEQSK